MKNLAILLSAAAFVLISCAEQADVYTLYRNSVTEPELRLHFATFDAVAAADEYNKQNCETAEVLFETAIEEADRGQLDYWCEEGRFRK